MSFFVRSNSENSFEDRKHAFSIGKRYSLDSFETLDSELKILLEDVCGAKTSISLKKQDPFTKQSLEWLISEALIRNRDYIFVLVEDLTHKVYFFDAVSFCQWVSVSHSLRNPLNNSQIIDAKFYIVSKNQNLRQIESGEPIHTLCTLKEYLNESRNILFHIMDLADPTNNKKRHLLECNLALDLLFGRGVIPNTQLAIRYSRAKAKENNPYCQLLMAICYRKKIGVECNKQLGAEQYKKAQSLLEDCNSKYKELKRLIEKEIPKEISEPTLLEIYFSQKIYSIILP